MTGRSDDLPPPPPPPPPGPPARTTATQARTDSAESRRSAARDLARAWQGVETFRYFLWMFCAGAVFWAWNDSGWGSAVGWAAAALCVAGVLQVRKRPFRWSLIVAIGLTPVCLFFLSLTGHPLLQSAIVTCLLGVWIGVPRMRRAERLAKEHPDLFGARRMSGGARKKKTDEPDAS